MYWLSGEDVPLQDIIPASLSQFYYWDEPRDESVTRLASELLVVAPLLQAAVVADDFMSWAEAASAYVDAVLDHATRVLSKWVVRHPARESVAIAELDELVVTWHRHKPLDTAPTRRVTPLRSTAPAHRDALDDTPRTSATSPRSTAPARRQHVLDNVPHTGVTSSRLAARSRGEEEEEKEKEEEKGVRRGRAGRGDKPKGLEAGEQALRGASHSPSPHPRSPSSPPPPYLAHTPTTTPNASAQHAAHVNASVSAARAPTAPTRRAPVNTASPRAAPTPAGVLPQQRCRADAAPTLVPVPVPSTTAQARAPQPRAAVAARPNASALVHGLPPFDASAPASVPTSAAPVPAGAATSTPHTHRDTVLTTAPALAIKPVPKHSRVPRGNARAPAQTQTRCHVPPLRTHHCAPSCCHSARCHPQSTCTPTHRAPTRAP
ncbi:hypothetical protein FA95DRAFT_1613630 [Auriscalpium vulgare]|uniref:Uncharacterized protein n=1 Tax=Auriscalpium vulgare TaxID=40419 RepID=A0ACB8R211_9AGAM|nr:hypothetical protein FA95DRAFT_1613630 [Auriscalpium vulgare]